MKFGLALVFVFCACRQEGSDPPIDEPDAAQAPPDARSVWPDGTPHPESEVWVMSWNIETLLCSAVGSHADEECCANAGATSRPSRRRPIAPHPARRRTDLGSAVRIRTDIEAPLLTCGAHGRARV